MDSIYTTSVTAPRADTAIDLNAYLLQEGFVPASLDGLVVAVPLRPAADTPALIPALVDGKVVAVPVHNPLATQAAQAQPAPAAVAPMQPPADPGLPLAVRHGVLYGSAAALAAGGFVWMVGAGIGLVAPHSGDIAEVLKWMAIAVATVAVGVAALIGKLRAVASKAASGASATATGDGANATGTVLALVHRTVNTNIAKQSAGWRGSVTNNIS
ncbi:hypothetical protein AB0D10_39775 [Kitasatospora sp. NPDC048545]|uniref:hypothetical protein n=1 Tax=Kitasatospora sp. NPDC048545 TaxID=3157208 RepID=UPI00340A40BF